MGRFDHAHETRGRAAKAETFVLALAAPALVLSVGLAAACGGAGSKGLGDVTSEGGTDTTGALSSPSDGGTQTGSFTGNAHSGTCDPAAADQAGCACKGGTRKCYSGSFATRGIGACHDGTQACSGGELPVWGPCMQQVLPMSCGNGPCDERAACLPHDAGTPMDSGIPPHCHLVQGYNGNGSFPDGSLYCEGNGGGGGFSNPFGGGGDGGSFFGSPPVPSH